ncbi:MULTISPECIES: LLM class flavin-dependent oxidoreductase [unclassified Mycolicibacterium]|uniref:LLM class flavin-dependent oxidoreductase n=1 Tax=unclassified Mycolicibacterium TaxID=2636767 RepID=UPI001390A9E3|nr:MULTISPECIES: LLM class flavin-dependent oxidoreductase [unclassified Mycolicibacterium]
MKSFGILLSPNRPTGEIREWATRFDDAGVDSLWMPDHLVNPSDGDAPWLNAWTLLGAIAERTRRCRIGILVSNFVLHVPLDMARLAATLDHLSDGRFDLGLGLGGASACRAATGVADDGPALVGRLEAGIESLLNIYSGRPVDLAAVPVIGGFAGPKSIGFAPLPVQRPRPPLLIGGHGSRVLDVAARFADTWNVYSPPRLAPDENIVSALKRLSRKFDDRLDGEGRGGQVRRSILLDFDPGLQPKSCHELADLVGTLSAIGFDEVIAASWPEHHPDGQAEQLLTFATDELPGLITA